MPSWCAAPPRSIGAAWMACAAWASPLARRRPEILVEEVVAACRDRFAVEVEEVTVTRENVEFRLPRALSA